MCLNEAEARGVEDPTTVCDVNAFFNAEQQQEVEVPLSPFRERILHLLNSTRLPPALNTYMATLPTQTVVYLSSLFSFTVFLLSHYIAHVAVATIIITTIVRSIQGLRDTTIAVQT